ncbi:MAG: calcium-translocating P-type ATPase, SERCA-type [Anaerolineales bacterium]|nr:calcium-translocating P-type ATPase, SERCA-type [Anaerolineales bacterium]MCX7608448.1 calcium-translocating P-type ATPase, SERCA-type [Anaerolineales bacterium]MDW8228182.1 calcium-translocating P-type ATPase, SERCA-type [Anaerolineales bacterium]
MKPDTLWHTLSIEETLKRVHSQLQGLSSHEASQRLSAYGPNELQATHRVSAWEILLEQFKNVLILILLAATGISLLLGHGIESIVIAIIVLFAVLLGFIQEYRAERAIEALKQMTAPTATVLRDGEEVRIPARDLVPGDVIVLHTGDRVPADARLLEAINLQVEEAALTGESVPVEKHTQPIPKDDVAIGDRRNMVYAGTAVTYGRGRALVVATGMQTEFGKIAQLLQTVETSKTPLQQNLDKVGTVLARAALVVVLLIVILGLVRGQPFIEMLIFGIALAVAVVPEALPAVVTISLAIGVQRMAKRNALIRRLPAVETLGSTSVICSDKTGTLTRDEMTVRKIYVAGQIFHVSGAGYKPEGEFSIDGNTPTPPTEALRQLLTAAVLASDTRLMRSRKDASDGWDIKGDPTEGALVVAAAKAGLWKDELDATYPRVGEIPFTSETKRMTTIHRAGNNQVAYGKGAPEVILNSCDRQLTADGIVPLDAEGRERILAIAQSMADEALRVLGIAFKPEATLEKAETNMVFLGLAGMIDPPRPEAKAAIAVCEQAGIRPVMITGDHPSTARAVARELGLLKTGRVVTGAELDQISDEQFTKEVETIDVYARVSPAHKLRVVTALQANGHIVAMTGDGVNDAPALKKADIGVAMGITGTDVTKEAAAMTLTDDNFASIVAAVEEGRGVFGNIKKYLMYLLSSNIGEILLMAGSALLGLPLPLTAVQILYVNLATDGLPALALSVDPPEADLMKRKPRNPRTGIFTRPVVTLMTLGGIWSAIINLGLFTWALHSGRSLQEAMTMTFVSLVLIQFFKAYNFRSDRHSVFQRPFANKWLNLAILWEISLLLLIVYLPFLHEPFNTYSLPLGDWLIVLALALTIMPVLELAKWMERRGWLGKMDS